MIFSVLFTISSGFSLVQENSKANSEAGKYLQLCKLNLENGNIDMAVSYGEKAVQLDENSSEYHFWLGQAYGQKAQKASLLNKFTYAKKCKREWEQAVQLDPNNVEARLLLASYYLQAPGIAGGDKNKAKEQASEILKRDLLKGHLAWAQVYESEKDVEKAEQEYRKAVDIDPHKTGAYSSLGAFYLNQKRYEESREIYLKILDMNPQEAAAYYQLGKIALLSGEDLKKGLEYLQECLKINPKSNNPTGADVHWRMGMICEKLGDKEQAVSEYRKSLELNPDHKNASQALKKISKK